MYAFDYVKPGSLADALAALKAEDAQPISGGQTLIPTLKQRLAQPSALVDLSGIAELKGITVSGGTVSVKAATRHADVAQSAEIRATFPALAALAEGIGDPQVRNRGTIGGSIANNDPAACYPAACLGTGATIVTSGAEHGADDFFRGLFDTALGEGEIVTEIRFPVPEAAAYAKFDQPASRFALVGVFVAKYPSGVRVAVTGAGGDGVFRWAEAEAALSGGFSADSIASLSHPADGLIADIHGSPDYRAHLIGVMTRRAVAAAG